VIDWEIDNNPISPTYGDLVFGDYIDHTVEGIDGLVQRLKIRLQVFLEEWFLDDTRGVPYFQQILEKGTSYDEISNSIKLVISKTKDVKKINSFIIESDDIESRKIPISFSVTSIFGDAQINNLSLTI